MNAEMRAMKFWELVSVFGRGRDRADLRAVLEGSEWCDPWGVALDRFNELCARQEREILDAPVPLDLSRTLARLDRRTWALRGDGYLQGSSIARLDAAILTTLEVHERFGGWVLEEVTEHGSFQVRPEPAV
jgi:hypothetical protein